MLSSGSERPDRCVAVGRRKVSGRSASGVKSGLGLCLKNSNPTAGCKLVGEGNAGNAATDNQDIHRVSQRSDTPVLHLGRPQKIHLANLDAIVTQDIVGSDNVEKEIGHGKAHQKGGAVQCQGTIGQRQFNRPGFSILKLRR